jgi:hypothetical protein
VRFTTTLDTFAPSIIEQLLEVNAVMDSIALSRYSSAELRTLDFKLDSTTSGANPEEQKKASRIRKGHCLHGKHASGRVGIYRDRRETPFGWNDRTEKRPTSR